MSTSSLSLEIILSIYLHTDKNLGLWIINVEPLNLDNIICSYQYY